MDKTITPAISVIMPVFNQAAFIRRALESLSLQTFQNWELIIINDGSTDNLATVIEDHLTDNRIKFIENSRNEGLGRCLNIGLDHSSHHFIAYLPADDVIYRSHLQSLLNHLMADENHVLSYAGVRHHYSRFAEGIISGYPLQLVQALHRKTNDRWLERADLVTDDLGKMFWDKLKKHGTFTGTGSISCEWVDHPLQRHKIIQEPLGGINPYKLYYGVKMPLRYHSTVGNLIDEVNYFKSFRERNDTPSSAGALKILLVGELAYNSERILALEEQGHKLYGLWTDEPYWYNSIGPLPFGHVEDIPLSNWKTKVRDIKPDVIYALLNWQAVPLAHEVLMNNPGIPFVWHFKEGPFICMEKGTWPKLIDLYARSDGQIYNSPEMRDWFQQFVPSNDETTFLLDGDLPKADWFEAERSQKLSAQDGEVHTVVPGRPIGLHPHTVAELAKHRIHLHFYGDFTHGQWKEWIGKAATLAPRHLHIHANCTQAHWVKEFSQYDAGWLHFFKSENSGELMRANWDDLNYPARMATLAIAGLPMLQRDNRGHLVATQTLARELNLGFFFCSIEELAGQLSNKEKMREVGENVWSRRMHFCFDSHAEALSSFFRKVISNKKLSIVSTKASA